MNPKKYKAMTQLLNSSISILQLKKMIEPLLAYYENPLASMDFAHQTCSSGIGLSQRGDHAKRFVHLDTKPRKAFWSY